MKSYTLKSLLLLTLLLAIAAATVARWAQPTPVQSIQRVLTSSRSDIEKLESLRQYFSIGDSYSDVLDQLRVSEPSAVGGGPLQTEICFNTCDLVLSFNADRTLIQIGYYAQVPTSPSPVFIELASAD